MEHFACCCLYMAGLIFHLWSVTFIFFLNPTFIANCHQYLMMFFICYWVWFIQQNKQVWEKQRNRRKKWERFSASSLSLHPLLRWKTTKWHITALTTPGSYTLLLSVITYTDSSGVRTITHDCKSNWGGHWQDPRGLIQWVIYKIDDLTVAHKNYQQSFPSRCTALLIKSLFISLL